MNSVKVSVYPTYTSEVVYVDGTGIAPFRGEVQLVNTSGQSVYSSSINNTAVKAVDVSKLRSGVYFLRVVSDKENSVSRIIVK